MLAAEAAGAFAGVAPKASGLDASTVRKIPARKRTQEQNQRREREKRFSELLMHSLADARGSVFKVSTSEEVEVVAHGQPHYKRKSEEITSRAWGCPKIHSGGAIPTTRTPTDV
jgi:hypothetical protein